MKNRRLGRIEIFRLLIAQRSAAEGDHPAAAVGYRESDAPTKILVMTVTTLRKLQEPHLDHCLDAEPLPGERGRQRAAPFGSEPDPEPPNSVVVEPARTQILQCRLAFRQPQPALAEAAGRFDAGMQSDLPLLPLPLGGGRARDLEPGDVRELLDRLRERQPLGFGQERDDVAVCAATEAVIEALVVADGERGRLLGMEGTEAEMLSALLLEPDAPAHDLGYRDSLSQF